MQSASRKSLLTCGLVGCGVAVAELVVVAGIAFFVDRASEDTRRQARVAREQPRPPGREPERPAAERSRPAEPSEWAPHPSYPTPEAAGTQAVYLLEEPERGPLVTLARDLLFAASCSGPGCSVLNTVRESEKAEHVEV